MSSPGKVPILLVDDQAANLLALEGVLGDLDVTLVRATSGDEALLRVLATDFAVIVLDVQMPGMSGFEVVELLRSRPRSRTTPVIFLTGGESAEFPLREAYALGAVDYLVKPIVREVLRAKVAFFVDYYRQAQELREAERRSAEAALREQRELWHTTLSSIGDAVIATDPAARVTFLNREAERLSGWTRGEAAGRRVDEVFRIVAEETRERMPCPVRRVLESEQTSGLTVPAVLVARDGTERPIDDSAAPIRDASGKLLGAVLVFRDVTDKHEAAKRLRESEEHLQAVFDSAAEGLYVMGLDGRCTYLNASGAAMLGYRPGELIGRSLHAAIHDGRPDGSPYPEADCPIAQVARVGRKIRVDDEVFWRRDGTAVPVVYSASPMIVGGTIVGTVVTFSDVTERMRAEEALRAKTERLNLLVENIKDYAVVILDPDGVVIEWQGGAERITGFSAEEAIGRKDEILFTPEDRAAGQPEAERRKAARDGRAEDRRWHQRKDGSRFFADGVMTALYDDDGKLRGFGKVFKDATGEKEAEEHRRRHAERLKRLAAVSSRLNAVHDLDSVIGVVTEEARTLIGAREAVTRIAPDRVAVVGADGRSRGSSGEPAPPGPALLAAPIVGRGGETLGTIQVADKGDGFTDEDEAIVVQLAQMTAVAVENTRLYQALRDADRRKDEFLAMLAHELRNPLAPICNALALLERQGSRDATAIRLREMIGRQVSHLTRLVDDLLDVARITSGKVELRREPVELTRVITQAVETSRPLIDAKRQTLVVDVADETVWLDADPVRLSQVVSNLLNNAAKYTDDGGRLRVSARSEGGEVMIRVEDSGIGLAPEMLPRVFDLFAQASAGIARTAGGLGIGLTLARRLVELHGGTVSATSRGLGTGSEFTVRLPVAASPVEPSSGDRYPAVGARTRRVLVVDDNPDSLESMAMLLEIQGHTVETAVDGIAAVEVARAFRPEVMFLDLGLPGRDGYEVAQILRQEFPKGTLRLIALSGYGQDEDRRRTHEAGFDQHLVKPVDPVTVEAALHE